jgi:LysR family transcriptional regulator, nitrogen assimilation regulatory protein
MDIKQILYFKAVADCGSFARASERLHISQPAISAQISQLEAELNGELFVRHARGVKLTSAGRVFLDHGSDILARVEQARAAVRESTGEVSGSLTIGIPTTIANVIAAPLVERAKLIYPKLDLRIFEALSGEINAWHTNGRFDLSVLYLPHSHTVAHAVPLLREALYLLGPIDGASEQRKPIRFKELHRLPLYHTSRIHACRLLLDSAASEAGIDLNYVAEIDSITLLYEFVAKRGVFTVFPGISEPPPFQRAVDYRRIVDPDLGLRSFVAPGADRPRSKAIDAVLKMLPALAREIAEVKASPVHELQA